jgi:1A family penicillin-binding protein
VPKRKVNPARLNTFLYIPFLLVAWIVIKLGSNFKALLKTLLFNIASPTVKIYSTLVPFLKTMRFGMDSFENSKNKFIDLFDPKRYQLSFSENPTVIEILKKQPQIWYAVFKYFLIYLLNLYKSLNLSGKIKRFPELKQPLLAFSAQFKILVKESFDAKNFKTVFQFLSLVPIIVQSLIRYVLWGVKLIFQIPKIILSIIKSLLIILRSLLIFGISLLLTLLTLPLKLLPFKRKRGRPRIQSAYSFYLNKFNRFFKRLIPSPLRIAIVLLVFLVGIFLYSIYLVDIAHNLPSPEKLSSLDSPLTTEIYDRNGVLLYRLYEGKNRHLVKLDQLPDHLIQATISIEDKNFYAHSGVDLFGIVRAIATYFESGELQGGSTLTQQLIKNTLLTPDRTLQRKTKEIALAFWAEKIFNKQQILQMYFNEVPYGGPAWGIEAAAQTYFGKTSRELTLAESAYLAGLPASPTTFSPYGTNPQLGRIRQGDVLRRMVEDGYINQKQADDALKQELSILPPTQQIKAPHFVMYVRSLLAQKYGEKLVSQGGLKVITSLDINVQNAAESIVADEVAKISSLNVGNGAAMITDAKTGQILAMVGSKDYWGEADGNFNITTALRQPGSSIKPVTYVTGFKQGYSPGSILLDTPVVYRSDWEVYSPVNYDGKFHGAVSIRTALGSSYNIPAVRMLSMVGLPSMLQTASDLGITTLKDKDRYGLSLTLGGGEVKLIDMMTVYGTFAKGGLRNDATALLKVFDSDGTIMEDNTEPSGRRVLSAGQAYLITDILADNKARTPAFGPNSLLNIPGHTVAVKTGTTDSKRDNWTFGYTPEYVVGVWVGNNNNEPMDPALTSGVTGAAPIWNRLMTTLLKGRPNIAFVRPPEVVQGTTGGNKDLVISTVGPFDAQAQEKIPSKTPTVQPQNPISFTDPLSPIKIEPPTQVIQ